MNTASITIALLSLFSLGVPGNMLVIVTYVRNMTSSLRVYVLALAIAESAISVCVVIHAYTPTIVFVRYAVTYVVYVAVTLSMFLLVFVAIERPTATFRPHSINHNPQRAWKALLIITAAAFGFVALLTRNLNRHQRCQYLENCICFT